MNDNNIIEQFFEQVKEYVNLSAAAKEDWAFLLKLKVYERDDYFIRVGKIPRNVAFVVRGLFSQYYISQEGTRVKNSFIKLSESQTRLVVDTEYRFRGIMKIMALFMSGAFKKQTHKYLEDFKVFAENQ